MPFEDSLRLSLDALIDRDGDQDHIIHNPFAGDATLLTSPPSAPSSPSPSSSASSDSAHDHRAGPWAALRVSGSGERKGAGAWARGHARAQSGYGGGREPPGSSTGTNGHHPLRSAGLCIASGHEYSSITRPTLSRVLGSLDAWAAPPGEPETTGLDVAAPGVEERVVLVHEISPKDSLAGVALKYGITMAELRRTNHLWASDSIHLRKVLYIPLDDPSLSLAPSPSHSDSSMQGHSYSHSRSQSHSNSHHASPSPSPERHHTANGTLHNGSTIRRIPASQLSFFPPASKPSALPPPLPSDAFASRHTRHPPTPPRTFSSIFTALPIVSRLSFDSVSSTSDEQEHELDEVRTARASGLFLFPAPPTTPKKPEFPSLLAHRTTSWRPHVRAPSHGNYPPDDIPASHRVSWTEDEHARVHAAVRTVQLEPSLGMQLPRLTRSASVGAGSVDSRLTLRA